MDRTLIASLGFSDPDKREIDHDLVCEYICQSDVATKFSRFIPEWSESISGKWMMAVQGPFNDVCHMCHRRGCSVGCPCYISTSIVERKRWDQLVWISSKQEVVISKGEGQYKAHIGFCDCILRFGFSRVSVTKVLEVATDVVIEETSNQEIRLPQPHHQSVAIEVKVIPVSIPEIIRQIKLYRQYVSDCKWVVATRWRPSEADIATLLNENIHHVFIGEKFDQWKANRNAAPAQNLLDF